MRSHDRFCAALAAALAEPLSRITPAGVTVRADGRSLVFRHPTFSPSEFELNRDLLECDPDDARYLLMHLEALLDTVQDWWMIESVTPCPVIATATETLLLMPDAELDGGVLRLRYAKGTARLAVASLDLSELARSL